MTQAPALLIAGTTSDAGKSMLVAGLCRAYARRGMKVAPFKAQNMSNNSAVTATGGEIGRAQALQAEAAGLAPRTDFNPVLLKPGSDRRSQVIVHGRPDGTIGAADYHRRRAALAGVVTETLSELRAQFDLVLCEGAGSPAEVNLRAGDIANMGLARAANLPTIIVGDIDRGGVLAHFLGTQGALDPADQRLVAGYVVNKFRGDVSLLQPGLDWVTERTGRPVLGVVPFLDDLWIDTEDGLGTRAGHIVGHPTAPRGGRWLEVAAVRLPRLSNSTDVEALAMEPGIRVRWVDAPASLSGADLVVLPGSKSTIADLAWLRSRGLDDAITDAARRGVPVLGICGGFQMLCSTIVDDHRTESAEPRAPGLGLLDVDIHFATDKTVREFTATDTSFGRPIPVAGYEIHYGQIARRATQPLLRCADGEEGARTGNVCGTHTHGLLANDQWRRAYLRENVAPQVPGFVLAEDTCVAAERTRQLDVLADAVAAALDLDQLAELAAAGAPELPVLQTRLV